ncbi:TetR family transcriptional regulator [Roseinatronobacter thiooxidans]|uniref:TetR family transcriptional regulator n=1 Tax=Roseinatronobacter thiooxidans TaxID=121821 RepID=A0A2W7RA35_9RHOB|nr:TetR/AcrR family transcriptional regulator [Roseinatronobacter thiooxidans]PZX47435.1 TetR family transcriptional regulator [Roseinatronobacter thiooxidans]
MARKKNSSADVTGPRIRAAALRLFARHGYAAVSMRQIATDVGVQAGTLYLYTADKQSLLFDLMHKHMQDLLAELDALPQAHNPLDGLEQFTRFHIRFHRARSDAVFISYMELRNLEPENFERIEAMRRQYEAHLGSLLARGKAERVFDISDTKLAAFAVIAMLTGVNTWFRESGRLSLAAVEDIYWHMVRKAVGA